ncbi:hypothetical protein [Streptomyces sp. NPDC059224]|uniref:hypothetical protein n=1 Tax=Streptomyces sp. NPDC059224 TaxID=3346775 RepID=UPI0036AEBD99
MITVTATALAALAAIGGLWAQAVTTYWSQQTAKDQLQQSQEESRREISAQAVTVSAWVEDPDENGSDWELHILNRSPDPVPSARVALKGSMSFKGSDVSIGADLYLNTSRLSPCTELVFSRKSVTHWDREGTDGTDGGAAENTVWISQLYGFTFTDRDGMQWWRLRNGHLVRSLDEFDFPDEDGKSVFNIDAVPDVRKAASCGNVD